MSAEIQVDVTPTGYRVLGQECATPGELFALLAENKVTAVELRPGPSTDYEAIGKAIYGLHRIGVKLRISSDNA